jgi:hypothetical protein
MRQTRVLAVTLASLLAACGGGGSGAPPSTPSAPVLSVGGDYTTAVALTENTCGPQVTVAPLPTRIDHVPGATQIRLTHGLTYSGTVAADGAFSTDAQTVTDALGTQSIRVAGRFTRTGFDAQATVAVQPSAASACRYVVQWTGTKQGAPNVIP